MSKIYDGAYFQRWYHERGRAGGAGLLRKVAMAVAIAEFYLERPIRSVLDVGCGEAPWRAPLLKLRPRLHYQGVDSSEYAVARFGRSRNIALANFGQNRGPFMEIKFSMSGVGKTVHEFIFSIHYG